MSTGHAAAVESPVLGHVVTALRHRSLMMVGILAVILAYCTYTWFAFDVPGLLRSAQPERAILLGTDSVAHKVHVTKDLRRDELTVAVEGERTATYSMPPDWVVASGDQVAVDLGDGYAVIIAGKSARMIVPDYGTIEVAVTADGVVARYPGDVPEWVRDTNRKFDARPTLGRRLQVSSSRIEVHRYFPGWENFFFAFQSPLADKSFLEVFALGLDEARVDPERSNVRYIFDEFWSNPDWQHGEVAVALFETLLMAVLGTFTAAFVGLPLAFVAAKNFNRIGAIRFLVRRVFDFLRGIDMLIWSLIFIRAFGLGPLTGALAIAFTDTGTLGKLFSEAIENIDNKQVEGVTSTGANRLQQYRFGVIPQLLPVLISQSLYYLESNTRSATVIGALGAGGIGLLLVETMRTARDWENTFYIIILTLMLVILMDSCSSWLRRKLVHG
jgi:phosphonate transport system permease protein